LREVDERVRPQEKERERERERERVGMMEMEGREKWAEDSGEKKERAYLLRPGVC